MLSLAEIAEADDRNVIKRCRFHPEAGVGVGLLVRAVHRRLDPAVGRIRRAVDVDAGAREGKGHEVFDCPSVEWNSHSLSPQS